MLIIHNQQQNDSVLNSHKAKTRGALRIVDQLCVGHDIHPLDNSNSSYNRTLDKAEERI